MAEERSEGADNKHGRSSKKKNTAATQTSADDADVSTKAPSRVHIFKDKPQPGTSSKSNGDKLKFSLFKANTVTHSVQGVVQAAIFPGIEPPFLRFRDELARLKQGIEKGAKALYGAAMKAEDLEALLQTLRRTRHRISNRRRKTFNTARNTSLTA